MKKIYLDGFCLPVEEEDEDDVGGLLREGGVSGPSQDEQPLVPLIKKSLENDVIS